MLGSAVIRSMSNEGANLLTATREQLDLTDRAAVLAWMVENQPELIFHIAAKVGGIQANSLAPADFLRDNLLIQTNVIEGAHKIGVQKLIFVATNCVYPQHAAQPLSENAMLTGPMEPHVRYYAIGKVAGIELCRAYNKQFGCNFISVIPPNLYGPGDNYDSVTSHIVAGIMRRVHQAKTDGRREFVVWGDGTARRELLHVDDVASAMKCLMTASNDHDLYNIGCGRDLSVIEIARLICEVVGFSSEIVCDATKPNGTIQKLLDPSRMFALGWRPGVAQIAGMKAAYHDFLCRFSEHLNATSAQ
jgi:GDP-L-fucose synthase